MGRKKETRTIDGLEFTCIQLPALKAFTLASRLAKGLAPLLGTSKLGMNTDLKELGSVLASSLNQFPPVELQSILKELLACCSVKFPSEGEDRWIQLVDDKSINLVFEGRLASMFKVGRFSLEVNFADFFDVSAGPSGAVQRESNSI